MDIAENQPTTADDTAVAGASVVIVATDNNARGLAAGAFALIHFSATYWDTLKMRNVS